MGDVREAHAAPPSRQHRAMPAVGRSHTFIYPPKEPPPTPHTDRGLRLRLIHQHPASHAAPMCVLENSRHSPHPRGLPHAHRGQTREDRDFHGGQATIAQAAAVFTAQLRFSGIESKLVDAVSHLGVGAPAGRCLCRTVSWAFLTRRSVCREDSAARTECNRSMGEPIRRCLLLA